LSIDQILNRMSTYGNVSSRSEENVIEEQQLNETSVRKDENRLETRSLCEIGVNPLIEDKVSHKMNIGTEDLFIKQRDDSSSVTYTTSTEQSNETLDENDATPANGPLILRSLSEIGVNTEDKMLIEMNIGTDDSNDSVLQPVQTCKMIDAETNTEHTEITLTLRQDSHVQTMDVVIDNEIRKCETDEKNVGTDIIQTTIASINTDEIQIEPVILRQALDVATNTTHVEIQDENVENVEIQDTNVEKEPVNTQEIGVGTETIATKEIETNTNEYDTSNMGVNTDQITTRNKGVGEVIRTTNRATETFHVPLQDQQTNTVKTELVHVGVSTDNAETASHVPSAVSTSIPTIPLLSIPTMQQPMLSPRSTRNSSPQQSPRLRSHNVPTVLDAPWDGTSSPRSSVADDDDDSSYIQSPRSPRKPSKSVTPMQSPRVPSLSLDLQRRSNSVNEHSPRLSARNHSPQQSPRNQSPQQSPRLRSHNVPTMLETTWNGTSSPRSSTANDESYLLSPRKASKSITPMQSPRIPPVPSLLLDSQKKLDEKRQSSPLERLSQCSPEELHTILNPKTKRKKVDENEDTSDNSYDFLFALQRFHKISKKSKKDDLF
jgi:hypothetical protein